jgi:hypothetical protein
VKLSARKRRMLERLTIRELHAFFHEYGVNVRFEMRDRRKPPSFENLIEYNGFLTEA